MRIWRQVLITFFVLLYARQSLAAIRDENTDLPAFFILVAGGGMLSFFNFSALLPAFAGLVPLINGLQRTHLIVCPEPLLVFFGAILLGHSARALLRLSSGEVRWRSAPTGKASLVDVSSMLLGSIILLSLLLQSWHRRGDPSFVTSLLSVPTEGYASPYYFFTSAVIWMQGLVFFWKLREESRLPVKPVLIAYAVTLLFFAFVQKIWALPEGARIAHEQYALTSPYEDIHSLGAITVAVFLGLLTAVRRPSLKALIPISGTAAILIACWSRATWLACLIGVALLGLCRMPVKWSIVALATLVALVLIAGPASKTESWNRNIYLSRLGTLIRLENPIAKDPTRFALYQKACAMIKDRPLTGHGIGSFHVTSTHFARPDDPFGAKPEFAHNFLLQFAAELGLPASALLLALIGAPLLRGIRCSLAALRAHQPDHPAVGLTLALLAYLLTQLTSNALNIYPTHQYFFWFLLAALLTAMLPHPQKMSSLDSSASAH